MNRKTEQAQVWFWLVFETGCFRLFPPLCETWEDWWQEPQGISKGIDGFISRLSEIKAPTTTTKIRVFYPETKHFTRAGSMVTNEGQRAMMAEPKTAEELGQI